MSKQVSRGTFVKTSANVASLAMVGQNASAPPASAIRGFDHVREPDGNLLEFIIYA